MIKKLLHHWQGYLKIEIRGNALGRFINQINELGIVLWNIEYLSYDHYKAYIYKDDFNKLRPLLRKRKCQVRIIEKKGTPFLFLKIRKRIFLLLGMVIFVAIFQAGSSFLWFYQITGLDNISEEEILQVLKEIGIRKGMLKKEIDTSDVENQLLQNIPGISWVDARWQGTLLYINIVEKRSVEPAEKGIIVAQRDGIISKLIVLKGKAVVKEGDTVNEGQVLIVPEEDGEALAIVNADIWYDAVGEASIYNQTILNTGRNKTYWSIRVGSRFFRFFRATPPFDQYRLKRTSEKIFIWRNIALPIELIKEEYQEITILKEKWTPEISLFKAKESALAEILLKMDKSSIIDSVYYEVLENSEEGKIKIRLMIKAEANIALLKEDFSGRD